MYILIEIAEQYCDDYLIRYLFPKYYQTFIYSKYIYFFFLI